jgi:putative SOS response-associated peptidase YedK
VRLHIGLLRLGGFKRGVRVPAPPASPGTAVPRLSFDLLRWGLVPFWAKDPSMGNRMINARSETVAEKPAFRQALRERRCIVPASGFYEWKGKKGGQRRPHLFRPSQLAGQGPLFGFAGLWESWRGAEDEVIESCTILTTEANSTVADVHHRMPVILDRREYSRWLDPEASNRDLLLGLLVPCSPERIVVSEVSTRVNNPRVDDAACAEAI